jgi:hypothetical protein
MGNLLALLVWVVVSCGCCVAALGEVSRPRPRGLAVVLWLLACAASFGLLVLFVRSGYGR